MTMHSLTTPARAAIAAAVLAAVSTGASAFVSNYPDPFRGQTVILQDADGDWIGLPNLGYTRQFVIDQFGDFRLEGDVYNYAADFFSALSDDPGGPAVRNADLGPPEGVTRNFIVHMPGREDPFSTGVFDMELTTADFSGLVEGDVVNVSLANLPTARVSIQEHPGGGYDIVYITAFQINGQYNLNGGENQEVPGLGDVNGQPPVVPVPATAALALPGLLGLAAMRRRRLTAAA